jgi:hypothetical protein
MSVSGWLRGAKSKTIRGHELRALRYPDVIRVIHYIKLDVGVIMVSPTWPLVTSEFLK